MKCPIGTTHESADQLLAYTARQLDPAAAAVLEEHMAVCPECRAFADNQTAVWKALDAWEAMPVSPDFDRRLYRRIEEHVSWWDRFTAPFRPLLVRQGLPAAAALCLVVTAGLMMGPAGREKAPTTAVEVQAVQLDQVEDALDDLELLREFHRTVRADSSRAL